jgi:hypothetical protein
MRADERDGGTLNPSEESSQRRCVLPSRPPGARPPLDWGAAALGSACGAVFFFSNRLGCGGSILVSLVGTLLLLLVAGVIRP